MRSGRRIEAVAYRRQEAFIRSARAQLELARLGTDRERTLSSDLAEEERLQILVEHVARTHTLDPRAYGPLLADEVNQLRSPCPAPTLDRRVRDIALAWRQPEAAAFWREWGRHTTGYRAAAYEGTRAAAVATATVAGPYFRSGYDHISRGGPLRDAAEHLAAITGRAGRSATQFALREYTASTRHLPQLAAGAAFAAMDASAAAVRELAAMFPESPIGRYVVVDGTDIPAWCLQRSAKRGGKLDVALEEQLRRRVPRADFRMYSADANGLFDPDVEPSRRARRRHVKAWRGYVLVVACDLVTGLPLAAVLEGASLHEPKAIYELLPMLYALWPNMPLEAVVADAMWDVAEIHEYCEVHFGVHLIARRTANRLASEGKLLAAGHGDYRGGIARIDGSGMAYCREHKAALIFQGTEAPSRAGLLPGEPFDPADAVKRARGFRSRWVCEHGCGRLTFPTRLAWTALPYYPHTPRGRPDLHAFRLAAGARRNVVESLFASMKANYRAGCRGTVRTRLYDVEVVEMLIWLALLSRSLVTLASARGDDEGSRG